MWDALHAAAEADLTLAQAIVDSAGVIVQRADLTVCYDERGAISIYSPSPTPASCPLPPRNLFNLYCSVHNLIRAMMIVAGAKYELPKYVWSEPTNLIDDN
ncbi:hypothetical protein NL676_008434 [Syzygium grande]|nr:hypothetical protein NL676_008434 [Syzygium grande]